MVSIPCAAKMRLAKKLNILWTWATIASLVACSLHWELEVTVTCISGEILFHHMVFATGISNNIHYHAFEPYVRLCISLCICVCACVGLFHDENKAQKYFFFFWLFCYFDQLSPSQRSSWVVTYLNVNIIHIFCLNSSNISKCSRLVFFDEFDV